MPRCDVYSEEVEDRGYDANELIVSSNVCACNSGVSSVGTEVGAPRVALLPSSRAMKSSGSPCAFTIAGDLSTRVVLAMDKAVWRCPVPRLRRAAGVHDRGTGSVQENIYGQRSLPPERSLQPRRGADSRACLPSPMCPTITPFTHVHCLVLNRPRPPCSL